MVKVNTETLKIVYRIGKGPWVIGDVREFGRDSYVSRSGSICLNVMPLTTIKVDNERNVGFLAFGIKKVIYNPPATIVIWEDDSKTVVKCHVKDTYSPFVGLMACIVKKLYGDEEDWYQQLSEFFPTEKEQQKIDRFNGKDKPDIDPKSIGDKIAYLNKRLNDALDRMVYEDLKRRTSMYF